jgi:hypothetical protein
MKDRIINIVRESKIVFDDRDKLAVLLASLGAIAVFATLGTHFRDDDTNERKDVVNENVWVFPNLNNEGTQFPSIPIRSDSSVPTRALLPGDKERRSISVIVWGLPKA